AAWGKMPSWHSSHSPGSQPSCSRLAESRLSSRFWDRILQSAQAEEFFPGLLGIPPSPGVPIARYHERRALSTRAPPSPTEFRNPTAAMPKLYIETVGCQMNMLDSELVVASLRKQGYELVPSPQQADTILFNTCSVRQHAEDKIYSALGRLKHEKKQNPGKFIGVLG